MSSHCKWFPKILPSLTTLPTSIIARLGWGLLHSSSHEFGMGSCICLGESRKLLKLMCFLSIVWGYKMGRRRRILLIVQFLLSYKQCPFGPRFYMKKQNAYDIFQKCKKIILFTSWSEALCLRTLSLEHLRRLVNRNNIKSCATDINCGNWSKNITTGKNLPFSAQFSSP